MRLSTLPLMTTAVLAISSLRCAPPTGTPVDAGAISPGATGGAQGGTGGAATGSGGNVSPGTGGAISGTGGNASGTGGSVSAGTGGAASGTGGNASGTGGAASGTGGSVSMGTGGRGTGGNASGTGGSISIGTGGRGTGGAGGIGDDGRLFTDAGVATPGSGGSVGMDAAVPPRPDASSDGPLGDGNVATASIPLVGLTAVFTQKGLDVTVVITATKCAAGSHTIQIHNGFSCDSAATQGPVWGNTRGAGIPAMTCNASMQGTLTYTRSGANAATSWTVGDHNTSTDVTLHPITLDANCGTFF